jgi:predicted regulator of Ras-like GTPase activity (Roadblock/LC7/MglB family)
MTLNPMSTGLIAIGTPEEKQQVEEALKLLMDACPGTKGALVATADGFVISASFKSEVAMRSLAAITSSIMSLAESLAKETEQGVCRNLVIEAEAGNAVALRINRTRILTVVAEHRTRLGMLLSAAKRCTESLANIKEEGSSV